jgi:hypothetical protein
VTLDTKRLVGAGIGALYALSYGIWTMIATGGGHGNFIWLWLFIVTHFFGGFFIVMGALAVELRTATTRLVFASLITLNFATSTYHIEDWVRDTQGTGDFATQWQRDPFTVLLCGGLHFAPLVFFAGVLIRDLFESSQIGQDEGHG